MKHPSAFEIHWPRKIATPAEAVRFIDALGFCVFFPITGLPLASLCLAVTGRNPHVEFKWDKKMQMLWRWKDELPRKGRAFYGKYFKGRGTFISTKFLPYFLAIHGVAVAPGDDERFYAEGRIRDDARVIWANLAKHGPLPTLELRHACGMDTAAANKRFKRAMLDLQRLLIVVHFGVEQETAAWASGRFELTCRAFSKETAAAREISPAQARAALAARYLERYPAANADTLRRLFGWSKTEALAAIGQSPK